MSGVYIFVRTVVILLELFSILMFVRAICSWIQYFRESFVYRISFVITEPLLSPVRNFLMRFQWARNCPLDISFLIVYLFIQILSTILVSVF